MQTDRFFKRIIVMENTHIDSPVKMDDDDEPIIFKCFMRMASVYEWLDEEDF